MCDDPLLPDAVSRALAEYRDLRDRHGVCWGEEPLSYVVQAWATVFLDHRHPYWDTGMRQLAERLPEASEDEVDDRMGEVDVDRVVRDALGGELLPSLAALRLRLRPSGVTLEAHARTVLGDEPIRTWLLLDSSRDEPATLIVDGTAYEIPPHGAKIVGVRREVVADGAPIDLAPLTRRAEAATVRLRAGFPCRWSVTSADGQGWYPEGRPPKVDGHGRPYFHGDDLVVAVPAEPITVTVTRGMEYTESEVGLRGLPERFHTGFSGTVDWPPNAVACEELHRLGAVLGYGHPFHSPVSDDDPPEKAVTRGRNCSAREIVADAALGLIDTLDVLNHSSISATATVYRRLIGAGNRLTVTAGTDAVLSFCHRGTSSGPPGWERVYARVDGPLTAESFAEAILMGRTFATTGPWLGLSVNGHGPGDTLDLAPGERVEITVTSVGPEVETLEIRTADRVLAQGPPGRLTATLDAGEATYVVAVATGGPHPRTFHRSGAYAHTSPVYLNVAGKHVARPEDVWWCLDWLDRLEEVLRESRVFATKDQYGDHVALYDRARQVYRARLG
ncbi:CehA/McbA family metallohydrolase [Nonomuraea cavernae]|uniref:CehA/McbA family metallohydrolase n=1 Tax=Nonomuraea cavernae TaxID=2045107 RepID=UPI0033CC8068